MGNRTKTQEFILNMIRDIARDSDKANYNLYKEMFDKMNDKQFDEFMVKLKNGDVTLSIIKDNSRPYGITLENNFAMAKKLGFDFFQNIKVSGSKELPDYITPNKYLVYKLPIKRAAQLLSKKISIPTGASKIDTLTGQVTGEDKAAKLTMPELQILSGYGAKMSILELMKTRGGDLGEGNAMTNLLFRDGFVTQASLRQYQTQVVSTKTLVSYFAAMHIKADINDSKTNLQ